MAALSRAVVGLSLLTGLAGLSTGIIFITRPYLAVQAHQALYGGSPDDLYRMAFRAHLTRLDTQMPPGRVVILGDSLVQDLLVSGVSPDAVNFGIGFDTIDGLIDRVGGYRSVAHAKAIIVAIGTNDIPFNSGERIDADITRLLAILPATVPLFLDAILPVDDRLRPERPLSKIQAANAALRAACGRVSTCHFIDPSSLLADGDGRLDHRNHVGDGLHLSDRGDAIWAGFLKQSLGPGLTGSLPN